MKTIQDKARSFFFLSGQLEIRLGEHIRSSTSDSSITRDFKVSSITNHPQYNGHSNDIAMVKPQKYL